MASYATVEDYELRTGDNVPGNQEEMYQVRLDDVSNLMELYMGPCSTYVEQAYPDILTSLTVLATQRTMAITTGIKSESVGNTSVTYATGDEVAGVRLTESEVLDALMAASCPMYSSGSQVGQIGAAYDRGRDHPPSDELWVMSRW